MKKIDALRRQVEELIDNNDPDRITKLFKKKPDLITATTLFNEESWLHYAAKKGKMDLVRFFSILGFR